MMLWTDHDLSGWGWTVMISFGSNGGFGVPTTMRLVADVERLATRGEIRNQNEFLEALRVGVERALREGNSDPAVAVATSGPTVATSGKVYTTPGMAS